MIDINLIPVALRKDSKGNTSALEINIPKDILIGVGAGVVLILLTVHFILGVVWLTSQGRLSGYKANWEKVLPDKNILDAISSESGDIKKKYKLIADITINKSIVWSSKFNSISDHMPRGIWIRKMTLSKIGLSIDGSAVSKSQNEINNVSLLLSALKQDDGFMKDFASLEENSIQRGKSNSVEVTDFTVMATVK